MYKKRVEQLVRNAVPANTQIGGLPKCPFIVTTSGGVGMGQVPLATAYCSHYVTVPYSAVTAIQPFW